MSKNLAAIRRRIGFPQEDNNESERFILSGGLNVEEPIPTGDAGKLIYCVNFEPNYSGGYRTKPGHERVDGRRQPSAWSYQAIRIAAITSQVFKPTVPGTIVTGATTGATAVFLAWKTVNGETLMIVGKVNPNLITADFKLSTDPAWTDNIEFIAGENIKNGANAFGVIGTPAVTSIDDVDESTKYILKARQFASAAITAVGSAACAGRALGVFDLNGVLYALRNNSTNTNSTLWKASKSGWVSVPLGVRLYFRSQVGNVAEGDVLTNGAATASFTVKRVVTLFGTIGSGDAIGYFITDAVTGGPFGTGDTYKKGGTVVASTPASGTVQANNSLPADSTANPTDYRFRRWNFSSAPNSSRIYGVNGQGPAFEFDGAVFCPIITGIGINTATWNTINALEKPTHIAAHADQLFLGYRGGALQHSGFQQPLSWTAVQGADTRQTGDDITNLVEDINGTMLIQTRSKNGILYGDVNENFQLRWVASSFGAYKNTACRINGATFLTDEGVMFQGQSQDFGNFQSMSESQQVNTLLRNLMRDGEGVIEAVVSRERSIYRLFFDSGRCLSFCIVGNEFRGVGFCDLNFKLTNFWSCDSTIATGSDTEPGERIFACNEAGFVIQDDVGGWLDGAPLTGVFQTQFYYGQQNIGMMKRYRRVHIEVLGADAYTGLSIGAEYDDGGAFRTPDVIEDITRYLTGGAYQTFTTYDTAYYDTPGKNTIRKELNNQGVAVSLIATFRSYIALPFTIQAARIDYATRSRQGVR